MTFDELNFLLWKQVKPERPYGDLETMIQHLSARKDTSEFHPAVRVLFDDKCVTAHTGGVALDGAMALMLFNSTEPGMAPVFFGEITATAFDQFCAMLKVPPSYLRRVSGKLAALNLNEVVTSHIKASPDFGFWVQKKGLLDLNSMAGVAAHYQAGTVRAVNPKSYAEVRMFDCDAACVAMSVLEKHGHLGWTFETGVASEEGICIVMRGPTGVTHHGINWQKGFILRNSENGDCSFQIIKCLVSGQKVMVWGGKDPFVAKAKHGKNNQMRLSGKVSASLDAYCSNLDIEDIESFITNSERPIGIAGKTPSLQEVHNFTKLFIEMSWMNSVEQARELAITQFGKCDICYHIAVGISEMAVVQDSIAKRVELQTMAGRIIRECQI